MRPHWVSHRSKNAIMIYGYLLKLLAVTIYVVKRQLVNLIIANHLLKEINFFIIFFKKKNSKQCYFYSNTVISYYIRHHFIYIYRRLAIFFNRLKKQLMRSY